jgi:hypothetical protein
MYDDRLTFSIVDDPQYRDPDAICVTLFQEESQPMAWFIGPIAITRRGVSIPYLPKSERQLVGWALMTAMGRAMVDRCNICVVDPEGLWTAL